MSKAYSLPDPRLRPDSFLTIVYKTLKCIEFDDRAWDKMYFARCNKRTAALLENLEGDVQMACRCLQELKDQFEGENLSWTIETILQYSFEWKAQNQRKTDKECLKRLLGSYSESIGSPGLARLNPDDVLKKLMATPVAIEEPKSVKGESHVE